MGDDAIEVKELTKYYGNFTAVDHVNFEVKRKEIFGLLGPNGAGKTTTIRMICGMLRPSNGTAIVSGFDVLRKTLEVKRRIGYVPDSSNLFPTLSAKDNLMFMGKLYGLDGSTRKERINKVLDLVELKERQNELIAHYSKGMHRRIVIAAALLHEPDILIMDEPTTGIDPQTARLIREKILGLSEEGKTVFLTTHQISEADRLCHRIGIIDHGKIVALDTPERLKAATEDTRALELTLREENSADWVSLISKIDCVDNAVESGGKIRIASKDLSETIPSVVDFVKQRGGKIETISVLQPTLEDAFISLTGKTLREDLPANGSDKKTRFKRRNLLWGRY